MDTRRFLPAAVALLIFASVYSSAMAAAVCDVWAEAHNSSPYPESDIEGRCWGGSDDPSDGYIVQSFIIMCDMTDQTGGSFAHNEPEYPVAGAYRTTYSLPQQLHVDSPGGPVIVSGTVMMYYYDDDDDVDECHVDYVYSGQLGCS